MKNRRPTIVSLLLVSEVGDYLFPSSVALYLLRQGYGAGIAGAALAATAVPSALFGPALGRWVDRQVKRTALLALSRGMAIAELAFLALTGGLGKGLSVRAPEAIIPFFMMTLALVYVPLQLIVQQYVVPSFELTEADAYARWEPFKNGACCLAG